MVKKKVKMKASQRECSCFCKRSEKREENEKIALTRRRLCGILFKRSGNGAERKAGRPDGRPSGERENLENDTEKLRQNDS